MATKRMISNTLSGSRKFANLQSDSARMLYMLLITHTDAYGRVDADPIWVKGQVLTRHPATHDQVQEWLDDLHTVGLIHLYEADGNPYLEIPKFYDYNTVYPEREEQATIPDREGRKPPRRPDRKRGQPTPATTAEPTPEPVMTSPRPDHDLSMREEVSREEVSREEKTPPTPPQPEALTNHEGELPNPDELTNDNTLIWWTQYAMHPTGHELAARVTKTQLRHRWGAHEAVRLANLRTPDFVQRAWVQAERDANNSPQGLFVKIIEGLITPSWKQAPKPADGLAFGATAQHPEHGLVTITGHIPGGYLVTLPTGDITRVLAEALA